VINNDKEKLKAFEDNPAYSFFKKNTGKIEVNIDGDIQLVFFIIQPKCQYLTEETKNKFLSNVERETQQDKIMGLLKAIPGLIDEMDHLEQMKSKIIKLPPRVVLLVRDISTLIGFGIASVIIYRFQYVKVLRDDGSYDYMATMPYLSNQIVLILGYL
jgi:hypothetical protein